MAFGADSAVTAATLMKRVLVNLLSSSLPAWIEGERRIQWTTKQPDRNRSLIAGHNGICENGMAYLLWSLNINGLHSPSDKNWAYLVPVQSWHFFYFPAFISMQAGRRANNVIISMTGNFNNKEFHLKK